MNHTGPEKREQKFVLDCIAVSSVALGYEHMRPRLWSVLPGYDARNDPHAARYTTTPSVQRVPQKTTPSVRRVSQKTENKELKSAAAQKSLDLRNTSGAGHSREQVSNHSGLMSDIKPLIGYNGRFGFRRNTPNLRRDPSSFGEVTTFQLH
ncbi:sperm microtubule associated protein 1-like [Oncorhynchus nerka]|uniref:sperm microtubule associated protein 1-like n=1 Tax=Oncorhynchus nerka TaxID=8023 RepID=UPI0031B888A7